MEKFAAGFAVLVVVLVVAGFVLVWRLTHAATAEADRWFELLVRQRFDEAHASASPALRQACTVDELRHFAQTSGLSRESPQNWWNREYYGRQGMVTLGGAYRLEAGHTASIVVSLRRNDGEWHVESVGIGAEFAQRMRRSADLRVAPPGLYYPGAAEPRMK